ncbi:MAG TPA: peroxiredoxin [Rhodocyclaceae bacterium]|nr:peroxiredoxin [Rhodocyclaceae bacterium]
MAQAITTANDSVRNFGGVESSLGSLGRSAAPLAPGDVAHVFSLPDADMEMFDLAQALRRHIVVLYFYPRDSMPSSKRMAIEFSDNEEAFTHCGAQVVGVSLDDCLTHAAFCDEHGLSVKLLSDSDAEACRLYGVWQEREVGGVLRPTVQRKTFIIGRDGLIHHIFDDIGPQDDHAAQVLELVQELAKGKNGNRQEHGRHT